MRVAPIALEKVDQQSRALIDEGVQSGMYPETSVMQVMAHNPAALASMHESAKALYGKSLLGHRLQELLRIRSAQINGCDLCAAARKDDGMTDEDVFCEIGDEASGPLSARERVALRFLTLMANDHHAIDDAVMADLATEFSVGEIIELGWYCGLAIGSHRFMHVLDMMGTGEPFIGVETPQHQLV